jgi:hypothetical protein
VKSLCLFARLYGHGTPYRYCSRSRYYLNLFGFSWFGQQATGHNSIVKVLAYSATRAISRHTDVGRGSTLVG